MIIMQSVYGLYYLERAGLTRMRRLSDSERGNHRETAIMRCMLILQSRAAWQSYALISSVYAIGAVRCGTKERSDSVEFWLIWDSYNVAELRFSIVELLLQVFALEAGPLGRARCKQWCMHAYLLL